MKCNVCLYVDTLYKGKFLTNRNVLISNKYRV